MTISVCVGSSCHLKGSYSITQLLKENITKYHLEEKVVLKAAFCLGHCVNGVSIQIDDRIHTGIKPENFEDFFKTYVLEKIS